MLSKGMTVELKSESGPPMVISEVSGDVATVWWYTNGQLVTTNIPTAVLKHWNGPKR